MEPDPSVEETEIARVVRLIGGPTQLARRIVALSPAGSTLSSEGVRKWVALGRAPAERCLVIVSAVKGTEAETSTYALRPDVYGEAPREQAAA